MDDFTPMETREELIRRYRKYGDRELVRLYLDNLDNGAAYYLITVRYREALFKRMGALHTHYTSDFLEDELHDFAIYMLEPKLNGGLRLASYDPDRTFAGWITTCYQNYLRDEIRRRRVRGRTLEIDSLYGGASADGESADFSDQVAGAEPLETPEDPGWDEGVDKWDQQMVLMLELIGELSPRDQYILLTYLFCKRYESRSVPFRLPQRIADSFRAAGYNDMKSGNVSTAFSQAKKRLRELLQQKKEQLGL